jgi:hypothetical protein
VRGNAFQPQVRDYLQPGTWPLSMVIDQQRRTRPLRPFSSASAP